MKRLVLLILFVSCVSASALTKDELIRQIRGKVGQLEQELGRAQNAAASADGNVERLQGELDTAQTQVNTVGKERDDWKAYGDDRNEKWLNAEVRVAKKDTTILKLYGTIAAMTLAIGAYLVAKFYFRLPI